MTRTVVVGAGLGGLLAAAELRRRGVDVTVLESQAVPGGVAGTMREHGYLVEPAASAFSLPHPSLSRLLDVAAVPVVAVPGARRRIVWDGTGLVDVPASPPAAVTSGLIGPIGKMRTVAEVGVRSSTHSGESVHDFMVRRFGPEAGTLAAHLAVTGVFAGDPTVIEAASYPQLIGLETASGSLIRGMFARRRAAGKGIRPRLHAPVDGMGDLAARLAGYIGDVRTGVNATAVDAGGRTVATTDGEMDVDAAVLAVAPAIAGRLLGRTDWDDAPTAPVAVVALGAPTDQLDMPDAFGILAAPGAASPVRGILMESAPGRAPADHRLIRVIVGGTHRPDVAGWDDERLAAVVVEDVGRIVGRLVEPVYIRVIRQQIPQYVSGHAATVAQRTGALPSNVAVGGWWWRGIGVGSLAEDAVRIADRLAGDV